MGRWLLLFVLMGSWPLRGLAEVKFSVDYGDNRSDTLVAKAREALARHDIAAVLAYANKCIMLYDSKAAQEQISLKDYACGAYKVPQYQDLNDVAMCYYILGEAYQAANMKDQAREAYQKLASDYSFGQSWDPKSGYWKPADAAREKLDMMAGGIDFGDYISAHLVIKAWAALKANDLKAVEAYANKTVELYGEKARRMQSKLKGYASGSNDDIFKYWALNDVGTALFILGEAYQNAGKNDQALLAYKRVMNEFSYAQTWDLCGWFWKPSEAARENLSMISSGVTREYGDHSSMFLVQQAWAALRAGDLKAVEDYANKTVALYAAAAGQMQASLKNYAAGSNDQIFKYWALNDVGTALYILGEAYQKAGNKDLAAQAYTKVIHDFSYAQCWDPGGWFWKPAEGAKQELEDMGSGNPK